MKVHKPLLMLQTFGSVCAVGLAQNKHLLHCKFHNEPNQHAAVLVPLIQELLSEAGININDLHGVAVVSGPGSYTGLRIGTSTAKGICWGANLPLYSVNTLDAMAESMRLAQNYAQGIYLPLLDARRLEVYMAVYTEQGPAFMPPQPFILDRDIWPFPENHNNTCFLSGDGAPKSLPYLRNFSVRNVELPHVLSGAALLLYDKVIQSAQEDLAYFEPEYLKAWGQMG